MSSRTVWYEMTVRNDQKHKALTYSGIDLMAYRDTGPILSAPTREQAGIAGGIIRHQYFAKQEGYQLTKFLSDECGSIRATWKRSAAGRVSDVKKHQGSIPFGIVETREAERGRDG